MFEVETKGFVEALRWASNLGISNVVVESDYMLTVQYVDRDNKNYLVVEVGHMI